MYHAFGLNIDSQIELPELLTGDGQADVRVTSGSVAQELPQVQDRGICFQTAPQRALITLDGVARFEIRDGNEIVIDPAKDVDESTLRLFVLGYCMGALLHQRGLLVLHASAVRHGNNCIAIAGVSSAGKSTLAAALCQNGFELLTDEVCAIEVGTDRIPRVLPAYPALLLWKRSLKKLDLVDDNLVAVRPELEKFVCPQQAEFCDVPSPLTHVYVLNSWNQNNVEIATIDGFGRFNMFLNQTYRERYLKGMGLARTRQKQVATVAPHVEVRRLSWPQSWEDIDEAVTSIKQDLTSDAAPILEQMAA